MIRKSELDLSDPANEVVLRAFVENSFADGHGPEALAAVDAALAKHPETGSLHELRGYALGRLERIDEAKAEYAKALELDPKNAEAKGALATLRAKDGRPRRRDRALRRSGEARRAIRRPTPTSRPSSRSPPATRPAPRRACARS